MLHAWPDLKCQALFPLLPLSAHSSSYTTVFRFFPPCQDVSCGDGCLLVKVFQSLESYKKER